MTPGDRELALLEDRAAQARAEAGRSLGQLRENASPSAAARRFADRAELRLGGAMAGPIAELMRRYPLAATAAVAGLGLLIAGALRAGARGHAAHAAPLGPRRAHALSPHTSQGARYDPIDR